MLLVIQRHIHRVGHFEADEHVYVAGRIGREKDRAERSRGTSNHLFLNTSWLVTGIGPLVGTAAELPYRTISMLQRSSNHE